MLNGAATSPDGSSTGAPASRSKRNLREAGIGHAELAVSSDAGERTSEM
jgi:hypothetical protein